MRSFLFERFKRFLKLDLASRPRLIFLLLMLRHLFASKATHIPLPLEGDCEGSAPAILFVDGSMPRDDRDAGAVSICQFMQLFVDHGWQVYLWPFDQIDQPELRSELASMGIRVVLSSRRAAALPNWLHGNAARFDVVFVSRPALAAYLLPWLKKRHFQLVYYGHDLHGERFAQEAALTGYWELGRLARRYHMLEKYICGAVDLSFYPSVQEVDALKSAVPEAKIMDLPPYGFDFSTLAAAVPPAGAQLLFVGNFGHLPNVDAAIWLVDEIWPSISKLMPEAKLVIAGSAPPASLRRRVQRSKLGITLTGWVSKQRLDALYRESRAVIVPLRFGAGVKHKVVSAVVRGCPVVTTEIGLQGLDELISIVGLAHDPFEFSKQIQPLIDNDQLWISMVQSARNALSSRFSSDTMWKALRNLHQEV
jgi:glycosyltransferase involved in cell wall biosynthesis